MSRPSPAVLRRAAIAPGRIVDLHLADGTVAAIRPGGETVGRTPVVDLDERPVVPGLVDHHLHLFGLAAPLASVDLSPDALAVGGGLDAVLRAARARTPDGWLRGVGYDVAASGPLDRDRLDTVAVGPLRIQDRTGICWFLDGRALDAVLPDDPARWPDGVEEVGGRATGELRRLDHWLGHRLPRSTPDLAAVGRLLVAAGITAVTDAGADNDAATLTALGAAGLPVRLHAMTRDAEVDPVSGVTLGPVKVLLDDTDLPDLDELTARIAAAHAAGRTVAVHCVTQVQLALALAAGIGPADRIEHASLVDAGALGPLADGRAVAGGAARARAHARRPLPRRDRPVRPSCAAPAGVVPAGRTPGRGEQRRALRPARPVAGDRGRGGPSYGRGRRASVPTRRSRPRKRSRSGPASRPTRRRPAGSWPVGPPMWWCSTTTGRPWPGALASRPPTSPASGCITRP